MPKLEPKAVQKELDQGLLWPVYWIHQTDPGAIVAQFAPSASKFEYGMRNPAIYAGLSRAIDYLAGIGWEAIAAHERELATRLKQRLGELPGVRVQTPAAWEHSSAIVNLAVDGVPGRELSKRLWDEYRVVQRAVAVRDELVSLRNSIREVRRRDIELPHAGMQPLQRMRVVGW